MRQVAALVEHAAGGGPDELQDSAPGGALAAAALADQAERLAAADLEVDAVDRVHGAHLVLEDDAAGDGEVDPEVLDRDQGLVAVAGGGRHVHGDGAHAGISAPAMSLSRWKQAERRPASVGDSSGTCRQHSSVASQRRGAKLQLSLIHISEPTRLGMIS